MKAIILFAFGLLTVGQLKAQQSGLKPGDEFAIQTTSIETPAVGKKVTGTENYTFQFKVLNITADSTKLECKLVKAKIWQDDRLYRINSDSIRITELNASNLLTQIILLQGPVNVVFNAQGKFMHTEGVDELIKQATQPWHLLDNVLAYQKPNIDGFLSMALNRMFFEVPKEKLSYQSTWTNANTKTTYKVTAIRGSLLDIEPVTQDKNGSLKILLNEVNGLVEDAKLSYTQTGVPDPKHYVSTQNIVYGKADASVIDTAWLNMAIPLSYWSEWFKDKTGEIDSAKTYSYFNKYEPIYKTDPFFVVATLSKANSAKSDGAFQAYRGLLAKTPNKYLAGDYSHLFNKLQWAADVNPDSAYNVIRYFYKDQGFITWLQESFSQAFLNEKHEVASQLIEKLNADKQLGIHSLIYPMYLWTMAKQQPNNAKLLISSYHQFMKMNDVYLHKGNGTRYALLTYKMLINAGKQKEAEKLLEKTTQTLERFKADTLNKNRYTDKNMLAYAYYLRYQSVAKTDSAAALLYLAKAAQYSPQNNKEKTYSSFYDRAFLESKESYGDEYINKLIATGDIETALKLFADNITANPVNLADMQKVYEKYLPNSNFKDFFKNKVVNNWADAPAFELTGIDGKKYALSDYKNKWLVVDFWGTWCGPCREEMPKVNEFNQELVSGKHKGIHLLSVSCYDEAPAVKTFVTNNNYGITVAMSDNVIQKNYKIGGYPSKILISPNGKMIDIPFGTDWQSVIKKFNELYAAN
ncbi:TlpA disulfide reductase family protein [Mucilaginibacter sp. dw_454]|uniref:TlpA family protein disulfide reductase n=1 Tax=Mucilaginibacter sp. dw_454 TaxID=2720079 RepID=UPI001BD596FD|nr:TlpA disulfide reductase family protein [Mucilaginibacter sp. dw_454]